jgi:galactose mutarotase-like enzyme
MIFQNQQVLALHNASSTALFAPQHGARLLTWRVDGQDIIHWPENANWNSPRKIRGGNPILFPFIARHLVDGQLGWWIDETGNKREMPMHGFAHSQPFSATVSDHQDQISMVLQDNDLTRQYYPYAFHLEVCYRLNDNELEVALRTTNRSERAMPYYPGHHFYFSLPPTLRETSTIHLPPNRRHTFLPDGAISVPEHGLTSYRFSDPQIEDRMHILTSQQDVRMSTPALKREITITLQVPGSIPWYAVTTWAERADDHYYCVEPWTGLPNAIHHRQGLRWLPPGQQESAICRIRATFS